MPTPCRVSVVIPTYNRRHHVERLLRAISAQTLSAAEFEVIVSIDGSDDGTREIVDEAAMPYRLEAIWHPRQGRAAACNAGIRIAGGDLLVLLDDDMEPVPGLLHAHLDAHQGADECVVLGPVPIVLDSSSSPTTHYLAGNWQRKYEEFARPDYRFRLRDFYTGNVSIRRELLLRVGGFDEAFTTYGNEDRELLIRLLATGSTIKYCPAAMAYHHCGKDFAALAVDSISRGRTAVLMASKHPEVLGESTLGTYRQWSRKWRLVRTVLLKASEAFSGLPRWIVSVVQRIERVKPTWIPKCCLFGLDYFFWLGAFSAIRENRARGQGLTALPRLTRPYKR
jgi:GT2 family glycosyltransferase